MRFVVCRYWRMVGDSIGWMCALTPGPARPSRRIGESTSACGFDGAQVCRGAIWDGCSITVRRDYY